MRLLLIRHATAEEPATGSPDALRPLTAVGNTEMQRMAAELQRLVPEVSLIASSPLLRAVQTAGILAAVYPQATMMQTAALSPGFAPESLRKWLQGQPEHSTVALVGHEPDLSTWATWALTGTLHSFLAFEKAGACLLHFPARPTPGAGRLLWLFAPAHLGSF